MWAAGGAAAALALALLAAADWVQISQHDYRPRLGGGESARSQHAAEPEPAGPLPPHREQDVENCSASAAPGESGAVDEVAATAEVAASAEVAPTAEDAAVRQDLNKPKIDHFKTLGSFIKLLKLVQESITKNRLNSAKDKLRYLEQLKNSILYNIQDRLAAAWPAHAPHARAARSSHDEHVDFPSAESALMTISFLTFSVFLIKLVMQVIQAYKAKTMMVTPVFAAVSRAVLEPTKQL